MPCPLSVDPSPFSAILAPSFQKRPKKKFTIEQDQRLRELVGDDPCPDWPRIAQQMEGKNARQCRERYRHYLDKTVSHQRWTAEEDELLRTLQGSLGNDWAAIAAKMPGRKNTAVKNRFRCGSFQKKIGRADPPEETFDLTDFEEMEFGVDGWDLLFS
jgi:hypothetical protein